MKSIRTFRFSALVGVALLCASYSQPIGARGGLTNKVHLGPSDEASQKVAQDVTLPVNNGTTEAATLRVLMGPLQQTYQDILVPASGQYNYYSATPLTGLTVNGQTVNYNTWTVVTLPNSDRIQIRWSDVDGMIAIDMQGVG